DDRGDNATTPFEEDLFLGARLVLNDVQSTECLAGVIIDADSRATLTSVEASRRFGDRWRLYLEYRGFSGLDMTDPLYGFRKDDYVQLELVAFF
ncbi:MAG: hypothetical protein HKN21_15050, partial [Candidatus Eisenbacteria bacterium]|nr:hypothetical protein [Candidatus Eisenbacteria bacterium]